MKTTKRILSILMMLVVLASVLATTFSVSAAVAPYNVDPSATGNLHIYKYEMPDVSVATTRGNGEQTTNIPSTATALPGVTFKITRVADLATNGVVNSTYYTPAGVVLPTPTEAANMTAIATYTEVTGNDGVALFEDLPLGIYLVQETDAPSQVTGKVADYVVSVPMTNSAGTAWNYDVYTYPKNETVYSDITIKKTDLTTGSVLEGAEFTLYTSTDNSTWTVVEEGLVTGEDGTLTPTNSLATSAYYMLKETKAPAGGYILDLDKETKVWIDADANVCDPTTKRVLDASNPYLIEITNDRPEISKKVGTKADEVIYEDAVIDTVGTTVYYEVSVTIPKITNMNAYKTLTLTDTLHEALTLNADPVLKTGTTTYVKGTDYTYTLDAATNTIKIDLIAEELTSTGVDVPVTVTYNCSVNENLVNALGEEIINKANLKYSTTVGTGDNEPDDDKPTDKESNETEAHTSGFQFKKVNPQNAALAGAKFKIFASEADALAGTNALSFMDANGNVISEAVSGNDGLVSFNGLGYGVNGNDVTTGSTTYYVVETYAPNGYNLLSKPVAVTVSQNSFTFANTQTTVVNSAKTVLPFTGGNGATMFYIIGGTFVTLGIFAIVALKKRKTTTK